MTSTFPAVPTGPGSTQACQAGRRWGLTTGGANWGALRTAAVSVQGVSGVLLAEGGPCTHGPPQARPACCGFRAMLDQAPPSSPGSQRPCPTPHAPHFGSLHSSTGAHPRVSLTSPGPRRWFIATLGASVRRVRDKTHV